MDYPFVKQSSEAYSDHVTSLTESQVSRKQITANTIRILLLEEQNTELRHTSVREARELKERHLEPENPKVASYFACYIPASRQSCWPHLDTVDLSCVPTLCTRFAPPSSV